MSFSMTPDMALGFKQRYKVDPYQVYQIVGACTAAIGVLVRVYFDYNKVDPPTELHESDATEELLEALIIPHYPGIYVPRHLR
jgi:glycerol uptake facilitator-like aquaporin